MKRVTILAAVAVLSGSLYVYAESDGKSGGGMGCDEMMKGGHMGMGDGKTMGKDGMGMMGKSGNSADMMKRCAEMMGTNKNQSPASGTAAAGTAHGTGVVRGVDAAAGKVTLQHEAIAAIGWPAMTMTFGVEDPKSLARLAPGQQVGFDLVKRGDDYVITSIR